MPDYDFYYDDVVHCGIEGIERNNINFLVGKAEKYIAKLGDNVVYYHIEPECKGSSVQLLVKDSVEPFSCVR